MTLAAICLDYMSPMRWVDCQDVMLRFMSMMGIAEHLMTEIRVYVSNHMAYGPDYR